jgi:apolipoprotein N-acyltransferase
MKLLRTFWFAPLVAGALMWVSFPPLDQGWLMPVGWALLFASMRLRRGARAGWQVFVAMAALFVPGVSWIRPLVWPMWLVVVLWCAGWESLWGRLAGRCLASGERPHAAWIVVLPAAHLLADMLRTTVLSGFPWMLPGYAGWRNPVLMGSMDLIGVHGATLATLMLAAGIAELACRVAEGERIVVGARVVAPAAIVWAGFAAWSFGKPAIPEKPGPTMLLLQPNISQKLKEDALASSEPRPTEAVMWETHERLAAKGFEEAKASGTHIDVVVWAETMVPALAVRPLEDGAVMATYEKGGISRAEVFRIVAASRGTLTLAGIQSGARGGKRGLLFNTVVLLSPDGRLHGHQDKQHLTPGGEYVPLAWLIPFREQFEEYLEDMIGFLPDLQPGEAGTVLTLGGGATTGVMICYESLFPEVPRTMVRSGANMLVNCSNYGWFAGTSQMGQALAVCAVRAAELRRSLVLASNNGICAVIGPDGSVRAASRADEAGYLIARAPLCDSRSPFAAVGEWAAWAIGAAGAAFAVAWSRRAARVPS